MKERRINLIEGTSVPQAEIDPQGIKIMKNQKRQKKGRWFFRFLALALILIIFLFTNVIFSQSSLITSLGRLSFWEGVARLVIGKEKILKGEIMDRVNILILGMGGAQHEGPYLTDTIILASLKPSTQQVGLLSIPRDLYVPIPDYGWQKINFANALGVARSKDGGALASQVVSDVFDLPIHYWVRVDFNLFKNLIDEFGGVEIEVENSFSDYQFPGPNFTYRVVSFEKGKQIMNGERALQFVRSRHGTNGEGSDFARAKRQQKLLFALKEKASQEDLLSQPKKIYQIYNVLKGNISSNLDISQAIRLVKLVLNIIPENIVAQVIEEAPNGPLKSEITLQGASVLKTESGSFKELAEIAKNLLNQTEKSEATASNYSFQNNSQPRIAILNGTYQSGLAKEIGDQLKEKEFLISYIGNTPEKKYFKNVIYQINPNLENKKIQELEKFLNVKIENEIDQNLKNLFKENEADLIIILGEE